MEEAGCGITQFLGHPGITPTLGWELSLAAGMTPHRPWATLQGTFRDPGSRFRPSWQWVALGSELLLWNLFSVGSPAIPGITTASLEAPERTGPVGKDLEPSQTTAGPALPSCPLPGSQVVELK